MAGIQVTVDLHPAEEMHDFLASYAFDLMFNYVAEDCINSRHALLTALSLDEQKRTMHITKLLTYKGLFEHIFRLEGKKTLPPKYLELFTGAEKE